MNARRRLLQALLAGFAMPRVAAPASRELREVTRHPVVLGRTIVHLVVTEREAGGLSFVSMHENERTAITAARQLLDQHPGRLLELRSRGQRLVTFWLGATPHVLDPNRMFTDTGIENTLRRYGSYSRAAHGAVAGLRDAFLSLLPPQHDRPVVALHNNAARSYSVDQYRPGGVHGPDAEAIAVQPHRESDAFFLVTTARLFEPLRAAGFSVVLQGEASTDDGSLSVWCQRHGRPYINVEVRHGRLEEQRRMLQAVIDVVG